MFLPPSSPSSSEPPWTRTSRRSLADRIVDALRYLSDEIEVRRVGGLGEAQAAGYIAGRLRRADFAAAVQSFRASSSSQASVAIIAALGMIAGVIGGLWQALVGSIIAAVLVAGALVWLVIDLLGSDPLRSNLPGKTSQSVVGGRAATGRDARLRVLVVAPLNSSPPAVLHRTGVIALLVGLLLCGTAIVGTIASAAPIWRVSAIGSGALLGVLWLWIMRRLVRPAPIPAIHGAGALATLLMIAEELPPLTTIEVWAIAVGGSATSPESIDALLQRYPFTAHDTCVINLHDIGTGQPCFVTREGVLREQRADRMLLALADATDAANPALDAVPCQLRQRTLAYSLLRLGFPALTISSQPDTPTFASPDATTIERCVRLVVGMVRALDEP